MLRPLFRVFRLSSSISGLPCALPTAENVPKGEGFFLVFGQPKILPHVSLDFWIRLDPIFRIIYIYIIEMFVGLCRLGTSRDRNDSPTSV